MNQHLMVMMKKTKTKKKDINGPTVMGNAQGLNIQEMEITIDSKVSGSVKINV